MVITKQWLEAHATSGVGFTKAQVAVLNVPYVKGWKSRMVGKTISDEQAREFERLGSKRRPPPTDNWFMTMPMWSSTKVASTWCHKDDYDELGRS